MSTGPGQVGQQGLVQESMAAFMGLMQVLPWL